MDAGKKSTIKRIIIGAVILTALIIITVGVYRRYFQFNRQEVNDYIDEECNLYDESRRDAVRKIIEDGVRDILSDPQQSSRILHVASMNSTVKEQELVHAAVMDAKRYGYL